MPVRALSVIESLEHRSLFSYTLQLIHASDFEAGLPAIEDAPRFATIVDTFDNSYTNSTLILSSGDNYIPGPFFNAGGDPSLAPITGSANVGRPDIAILNAIGVQASTIGNHEFDAGPREFNNIARPSGAWVGAQFPYLTANLDLTTDSNVSGGVTAPGQEASSIKGKYAKSSVITLPNGEKVGIVAATTPQQESITSVGGVGVFPAVDTDMQSLAEDYIQPEVDALTAAGVETIIVATHLQQINFEQELITFLKDVDIVIGGGSHTRFLDSTDRLRTGDTAQVSEYPQIHQDANGVDVPLVNTDGNYKYVGRLVIEIDDDGKVVLSSIDPAESGAYAADEQGVIDVTGAASAADAIAASTKGTTVKTVTDAVASVINAKDGQIFGKSDVYLDGRRAIVRNEETQLGNISADANLFVAKQQKPNTMVSFKNGGGIRDSIGSVPAVGGDETPVFGPPAANPGAGKLEGQISQLDIENSLRFNNSLVAFDMTAEGLRNALEHGIANWSPTSSAGQFPQIGGIQFSFDPSKTPIAFDTDTTDGVINVTTPGERVRNAALVDEDGNIVDILVKDGVLQGDPNRLIGVVTLNFLYANDTVLDGTGGDNYPFQSYDSNFVELTTGDSVPGALGEQAALGEYLLSEFPPAGPAFTSPETDKAGDTRIQNLAFREDTVVPDTIVDVSPVEQTVIEANTYVEFTLTRSGPTFGETTVDYSTMAVTASGGRDFVSKSGSVTFAAGETEKVVKVQVRDDSATELGENETFKLVLTDIEGGTLGQADATVGIIDTDGRRISIGRASVVEGNSGETDMVFDVALNHAVNAPVSVNFRTFNFTARAGEDYLGGIGNITFAPGETQKQIRITVLGDTKVERNEQFDVVLDSPVNAKIAVFRGRGTIITDDVPTTPAKIKISDARVTEGDATKQITFRVSLDKPAASAVTGTFKTSNGTAKAGSDYVARTTNFSIPVGQSFVDISVDVVGDNKTESYEYFRASLSSIIGASVLDGVGIGSIFNDD